MKKRRGSLKFACVTLSATIFALLLTGISPAKTESAPTSKVGTTAQATEWNPEGILEEKRKEYNQQALADMLGQRKAEADEYLSGKKIVVPDYIKEACQAAEEKYGVSQYMLEAIAWKESRFHPDAQNGPCKGLCQVNVNLFPHNWQDPTENIMKAAELIDTLGSQGYEDLGAICSMYHGEGKPQYSDYTEDIDRISEALMEADGVY